MKESYDQAEAITHTGFIAQEVEAAAKQSGFDFSGVHAPVNEKDNYSLSYSEFTVPLVKAVQELSAKNESLQQSNDELKAKMTQMQQQMNELMQEMKKLNGQKCHF